MFPNIFDPEYNYFYNNALIKYNKDNSNYNFFYSNMEVTFIKKY